MMLGKMESDRVQKAVVGLRSVCQAQYFNTHEFFGLLISVIY